MSGAQSALRSVINAGAVGRGYGGGERQVAPGMAMGMGTCGKLRRRKKLIYPWPRMRSGVSSPIPAALLIGMPMQITRLLSIMKHLCISS